MQVHRDTIRKGDRGDLCQIAQSLLARHRFTPANTFNADHQPDGIFGDASDTELRNFQRSFGLTVDGICGPKSWSALESV